MENITELIRAAAPGAVVTLPAGEFEGPFIISRPVHIVGSNTTLWSKKGPVIEVNSGGVTLEELRVELTEGSLTDTAIRANAMTAVKNVEVLGTVSGFGAADGYFDVPRTIELGRFAADKKNTFRLAVNVPERTVIECTARDLSFSAATLEAGRNELLLTVSEISAQTLLFAEILFRGTFSRRINITGKPASDAEQTDEKPIYTAPVREPRAAAAEPDAHAQAQTDVITLSRPNTAQGQALLMQRGQRLALAQCLGSCFSVYFTGGVPNGWEVDPYVFLLNKNGVAEDDSALIFFGKEQSDSGEARYFPQDGHIEIDVAKVEYRTEKIVIAYSIYGGNECRNFSSVKHPCVLIKDTEERVRFVMEGLSGETTVVAVEIYLYKGEWKISAVGAGYSDGIAKLCNSYGLEVE